MREVGVVTESCPAQRSNPTDQMSHSMNGPRDGVGKMISCRPARLAKGLGALCVKYLEMSRYARCSGLQRDGSMREATGLGFQDR